MNAKMPELKRAFESAGFIEVRTLLSSGNVVFSARKAANDALAKKAEAAMKRELPTSFLAIVRAQTELEELLASDPFDGFRLPKDAKRVVTFLREPAPKKLALPPERDGARILCVEGLHVFSAYVPGPRGPVFMTLIERTFGKDVTTRTWDTVAKAAR
jgi:uncharacterized protein (DUF1697 family)